MNLETYIKQNKMLITTHLSSFISQKKEQFKDEIFTKTALERIEEFSKKGKMLRGVLVLLSYEMFTSRKVTEEVLDLAVAMELTQSGALIHDDIMDNDIIRRGEKTIFAKYADEAESLSISQAQFYGQSMGMCVGDLSFYLAFELVGKAAMNSPIPYSYSTLFQKCISGQMFDFILGQSVMEGTKEEIIKMYVNKTGSYSVVLPLLLGLYTAGGEEKYVPLIEILGNNIGIIFQIKDDELGLLGTTESIGKPQGSDIRENKKTLVRLLLFSLASLDDKKLLHSVFGNKQNSSDNISIVRSLYEKYHIQSEIDKVVVSLSEELPDLFEKLPDTTSRTLLKEFYSYALSRTL